MGDIFDLTGPEFLQFYFFLSIGGFLLALLVRWYFRLPGGRPAMIPELSAPEVALLSGRDAGLANATLAGLIYARVLDADAGTRRLRRLGALSPAADPMDHAIFNACTAIGTRPTEIHDRIKPFARQVRDRLEPHELILSEGQRLISSLLPLMIMGIVLFIGITKIGVGLSRDRPVAFLVLFCLADFGIAMAAFIRPAWRTRRGDAVLAAIRGSQQALKASARVNGSRLEREDITLAFALFGPALLAEGDAKLRDFAVVLRPPPGSEGSFFSHGGGCGGGGSGCGGGGGGGGCGGCGGGGGH